MAARPDMGGCFPDAAAAVTRVEGPGDPDEHIGLDHRPETGPIWSRLQARNGMRWLPSSSIGPFNCHQTNRTHCSVSKKSGQYEIQASVARGCLSAEPTRGLLPVIFSLRFPPRLPIVPARLSRIQTHPADRFIPQTRVQEAETVRRSLRGLYGCFLVSRKPHPFQFYVLAPGGLGEHPFHQHQVRTRSSMIEESEYR
jgi:hypothetical protein